jgi:hypothetical protein
MGIAMKGPEMARTIALLLKYNNNCSGKGAGQFEPQPSFFQSLGRSESFQPRNSRQPLTVSLTGATVAARFAKGIKKAGIEEEEHETDS